jgi:hypothetical protein
VGGRELIASIVSSIAWPVIVLSAVLLFRKQLSGLLERIKSLEIVGSKAEFAVLGNYESKIGAEVKKDVAESQQGIVRQTETEFGGPKAMAEVAPRQAIIEAWGLLEYQLNVTSDRVAPDGRHGWPQVARNLESWGEWPRLYPAVAELWRLRDYTVESTRAPSASDAALYVSVAQDLVTTLRTSFPPPADSDPGGGV